MQLKEKQNLEKQELTVRLIDGEFNSDKALEIMSTLLTQKINFHKKENLQNWERNHNHNPQSVLIRIQELESEMAQTSSFLRKIETMGKRVKIEGQIKISVL